MWDEEEWARRFTAYEPQISGIQMNQSKVNIMYNRRAGTEICLMMSAQMLLVLQHTGSASKIDGTSVTYCNISQICPSKKLAFLPSDLSS